MSVAIQKAMDAMEILDAEQLQQAFGEGLDPNQAYDGSSLGQRLVDMYLRGPGFTDCVKVILDHGWEIDAVLAAVLTEDAEQLGRLLRENPSALHQTYDFRSAFTPLEQASLLHICAEYNLPRCAKVLLDAGMDVNIQAGVDGYGMGGQTPVFHTVNQHNNACLPMLELLLAYGADLGLTVKGLAWGKGYSWETFVPAVNPISYAMMGLLRQFQRSEAQIYAVVRLLMQKHYGIDYTPGNLPNRYLQ